MIRTVIWAIAAAAMCAALSGCRAEGCLEGDDPDCVVPSACPELSFSCQGGFARVERLRKGEALPGGMDALASVGDYVLRNERVQAVIDAIDHPHYLAPTGGALLDLSTVQGGRDALNHVFQATGLLPGDAAHYTEARVFQGERFAAVQFRGHLDGHPDQPIATRYEVRPCEPGIRVRTEAVNLEPDPAVWMLADGWYWGGASQLPFAPGRGAGFDHPSLDIENATAAFRSTPFLASLPPGPASTAYACIPCNAAALSGFNDEDISAMGREPRVVPPRDYEVFERFIAVADADSVAPAADIALQARRRLFGEAYSELRGRVEMQGGGKLGNEALATVLIWEGKRDTPQDELVARTQVTPDAEGWFAVRVPSHRDYLVEARSFGRTVARAAARMGDGPAEVDVLEIPAPAELGIAVTVDGEAGDALALIEPADERTRAAVTAERFGWFGSCAPWLGPPSGGSPACNRVLVPGSARVAAPPGLYDVYAAAGPFATLARERVRLQAGKSAEVSFALARLPLQPAGSLSADFHVHGGRSFDSSLPDLDRARSLLTEGLQVIAATDHDVTGDYSRALEALGATYRVAVLHGVETTGDILFNFVPGEYVPQVIGHFNAWPIPYRADAPRRGAPWDELAEPGLLFTRLRGAGWPPEHGIIQLNHPWESQDFGRDRGFLRAIHLNAKKPLPAEFDGTRQELFNHRPDGAEYRNSDYNVQEVMNGYDDKLNLAYRALWFYLLNQGVVRPGTANSDSHGLAGTTTVGTPRNLVWTATEPADFDARVFDADVRAGRMLGTNGPVIELELRDGSGQARRPSIKPVAPAADATLWVRVTAAPWMPVEEVRVVVNGEVARIFRSELAHPEDPFGQTGLVRCELTLPIADLVGKLSGDAWIVVEAGAPLLPAADLDCDGIPDTGDNNGDGVIDARDVGVHAADDTPFVDDPKLSDECLDHVGPMRPAPPPSDPESAAYIFGKLFPEARAAAFTNPLLLDLDGNGFEGVE